MNTLNDSEQRAQYVDRLCSRIQQIVLREAPPALVQASELWDLMVEVDRKVLRVAGRFERGRASKDELDQAAVEYLHVLRNHINPSPRHNGHAQNARQDDSLPSGVRGAA